MISNGYRMNICVPQFLQLLALYFLFQWGTFDRNQSNAKSLHFLQVLRFQRLLYGEVLPALSFISYLLKQGITRNNPQRSTTTRNDHQKIHDDPQWPSTTQKKFTTIHNDKKFHNELRSKKIYNNPQRTITTQDNPQQLKK